MRCVPSNTCPWLVSMARKWDLKVEDEAADPKDAVLNDPVVGVKDADGQTHKVHILSTPKSMTKEEFAEHCVTHLPFHSGCPFCVAGKKNNLPNRNANMNVPYLLSSPTTAS